MHIIRARMKPGFALSARHPVFLRLQDVMNAAFISGSLTAAMLNLAALIAMAGLCRASCAFRLSPIRLCAR